MRLERIKGHVLAWMGGGIYSAVNGWTCAVQGEEQAVSRAGRGIEAPEKSEGRDEYGPARESPNRRGGGNCGWAMPQNHSAQIKNADTDIHMSSRRPQAGLSRRFSTLNAGEAMPVT